MPNQPKIAVFGAGRWGKNHVRNFHELGALAAVVDPFPAAAETVAAIDKNIPVFQNAEEVLADPSIAGVVLATPAVQHKDDTLQAFAAGKDVFVEKPMAMNVADAEIMQKAALENNRILMVGHLLLYQPAIIWIKEAIDQGKIGKVLHVETRRLNFGTVRAQENVFWSFSPHDLAVMHVLLNEPALKSTSSFGHAALQPGVEDLVHADFVFESGCTGHVQASWLWPDRMRATTIIGDKGMIYYDEIAQTVQVYDQHVAMSDLSLVRNGVEQPDVADAQPLRTECQHFLDCIATRQQPVSHGAHGVEVIRMLEQASKEMKSV